MNESLIKTIWIAWIPVVAILFRAIGPRKAVLIAVIGGVLFLPADHLRVGPPPFAFKIDKWITTGLGLILGVVLFDRRAAARVRPHWLDLPMVVYVLCPLTGLIRGEPGSTADIIEVVSMRGIGWFAPYAMGRIYFGQADGPTRVGIALTIGGLAYIPFCLYEEVAGPTRYLAVLMYGTPYKDGMVERLGGWRPEVFVGNGLALASWMSLTTVVATWLWLGKAWRVRGCPAWLPPLALLATTLSCRGVYGYVTLAIGIPAAILTRFLRTRAILGLLLIVPFTYMALRASNLWEGGLLVRAAHYMVTGREGSIIARLNSENLIVGEVFARAPIFGFGTINMHDALWLHTLWMGGLSGLAVHVVAIFALPVVLGLMKPLGRRPDRREAASLTWSLACWCLLQLIEAMNNSNNFTATALVGGTLVGSYFWKGPDVFPTGPTPVCRDARRPIPVPLIVSIILLVAVEILGRLPRTTVPHPTSPALERPPAKSQP